MKRWPTEIGCTDFGINRAEVGQTSVPARIPGPPLQLHEAVSTDSLATR
jgi:hypothetical protein